MRYLILIVVLLVGCDESRRDVVKPDVIVGDNATAIHCKSASDRAVIYDDIADKMKSGQLKTVNDVVDYSTPLFNTASATYLDKITDLRKTRLHGADDVLPSDAEAVFRLFAKEYRDASH